MPFSPLIATTSGNAGQHSARSARVDRFIVHHAASSSLASVLAMMSTGSREVSANYVIKDQQIVGVVDEGRRAWTSGSAEWDGRAITVETCNSATGDESGWPISELSYASLARLIADCARRHGFPIDREHVIGHRELFARYGASYPTACPGGIDLDRLVAHARATRTGAAEGFLMALNDAQQQEIYDALVARTSNGNYYKTDAAIDVMRNELAASLASIQAGAIRFPGAGYNAFLAIINELRTDRGQAPMPLDEAKLAVAIADSIRPTIADALEHVDLGNDASAAAVADELARRLIS